MTIHDRVARYAAAIWGDLSADEIDALYDQLHSKGQRSIYIYCNRAECSALANSFDQLFKRLGWPSIIGDGGILALGATGIQVNPNDDTARLLKSAIEARTKIKVDISGIPRQPGDLNPTMLVIGPKPKYEKYFSPKLATATSELEQRPGLPTWCLLSQMSCKTHDAREHPRGLPAPG